MNIVTAKTGLLPPELLAVAYAPPHLREKLRWLLLFDHRLGEVLERAREPMIAQMRLAWWRDMLAKPAVNRPKGEPLLALLDDDVILCESAVKLVDAVELLVGEPEQAEVAKSVINRASAIFGAYALWVEGDIKSAEKLAMLCAGHSDAVMTSTPRNLRPLSILALSAQLERGAVSAGPFGPGLRLSWHALTGR
jgi:hypothetical protein